MSNKPILTNKQASKTLSAKKAKKKTLKQTLITPHDTHYRPNASATECDSILNILSSLPRLVPEKTQILWSTMKDIPQDQRKHFRQQLQEKLPAQNDIRKKLVLGINNVTKNLENNNLSMVLLSSDINPFYMAQHILDLCVIGNTPILIIDELRKELNNTLGIASICLGVTINISNEILLNLCQTVRNIWGNYPPPDDHAYNLNNESCIIIDDSITEDTVSKDLQDVTAVGNEKQKTRKVKSKVKLFKEEDCKLHLVRSDKKSRVFVPERTARNNAFNADFIRFNAPEPEVSKKLIGMQVAKLIANRHRVARGKHLDRTGVKKQKLQPNKFKQNKQGVKQNKKKKPNK